jgi:hypothetical protein
MDGKSRAICSICATRWTDTLSYVKDDACEAVFVEIDFLTIGDLSYSADVVSFSCVSEQKDLPDVGKCGGEVGDESAAEEWCASVGCHISFNL